MACLDLKIIEAGLTTYVLAKTKANEFWDEVSSTNDRAIQLARSGAAEGVMVLARQQSGGRGRQGNKWVSPRDSGIFVSFVLRPTLDQTMIPLISFAAGVAAVEAIERVCGLRIGLKWVNDLVYNGKKLGGILAEIPGGQQNKGADSEQKISASAVVLGMGINLSLTADDIPPDLRGKVESLNQLLSMPVNANLLVSELCNALENQYNYLNHSRSELVLAEWKKYCQTLGKRVKAKVGNTELEGLAEDIAESGALKLRLDTGEFRLLHAGEITIRLEDGRYA